MPGITFLFWNVNRQPLEHRAARIAAARGVDVLILAECETAAGGLITALNAAGAQEFRAAERSGAELRVFTRLPRRALRFQFLSPHERWLFYRLVPGTMPDFLLAVAHLPSKLNIQNSTQSLVVRSLVADIEATEERRGHDRTVLVGDLNMNPFEEGVAGAGGLHGVMDRRVADRESREIGGAAFRMFYNPMWGLLGDRTPGPPGTYYRSAAEAVNYFWNTYDQVLLRPSLADHLRDLAVLDSDGAGSLLTPNGLPDRANGSDHLPVFFRLEW